MPCFVLSAVFSSCSPFSQRFRLANSQKTREQGSAKGIPPQRAARIPAARRRARRPRCYPRTPSFAWNPVPGALRYEFQLSLERRVPRQRRSSTTTRSARRRSRRRRSPSRGSPARRTRSTRVCARSLADGDDAVERERSASTWCRRRRRRRSPSYPGPAPLDADRGRRPATRSGCIDAQQVRDRRRRTSLDEREFYTFHQSPQLDRDGALARSARSATIDTFGGRDQRPAGGRTYGAWSPIYTSTNPAVTDGPIKLDRHRLGRLLERQPGVARAPAHARLPVDAATRRSTASRPSSTASTSSPTSSA